MDFLEYQNFLAHAKGSFGAGFKKRISGLKAAGSKMFSNSSSDSSGSGSVGGKSGRKWKKHKYIAIINGRYIYPAKKALKQTFTKEGRQAKRIALARATGTAHERAAIAQKKYEREDANAKAATSEAIKIGMTKNKRSREYGAAKQRATEAQARRDKHLRDSSQYLLTRNKHDKSLEKMDRTEDRINKLRSVLGKEANASSKIAEPRTRVVRSKKQQHELNQQAIEEANKFTKKESSKRKKKTSKNKSSEFKKSIKEISEYAGQKIKSGNLTFGPEPEAMNKAIQESKKKKKKR